MEQLSGVDPKIWRRWERRNGEVFDNVFLARPSPAGIASDDFLADGRDWSTRTAPEIGGVGDPDLASAGKEAALHERIDEELAVLRTAVHGRDR